ncbi:MAG TPA: response regulator [Gemmatimonadales bacterium]|nr:response regulator [Gemmatimonadales bacterium]
MAAKLKALVIDDDKTIVALISATLRAAGYHVVAAYDAMQGFMLAQREVPAVILLDIQLPAGGGLPLLEKITNSTKTHAIPVVIVTGGTDPKLEAESKAKGATSFVRKPVDQKALVALVEGLVEKKA